MYMYILGSQDRNLTETLKYMRVLIGNIKENDYSENFSKDNHDFQISLWRENYKRPLVGWVDKMQL